MKNKNTTRFLLVAVLAIWGIVGWKIYLAMKEDNAVVVTEREEIVFTDSASAVPADYTLLLDYPDPFLGELRKPVVSDRMKNNAQRNTTPAVIKTPPPPPAWPLIKYFGLVRSPRNGKTVGFLSVDGSSQFISAGNVIENISVVALAKDSVVLRTGQEVRVYHK